jgi:tetratricopeptide (TPR) repeat protein
MGAALLSLLCAFPAATPPPPADHSSAAYLDLIEAWRKGDEQASTRLDQWPRDEVRARAAKLVSVPGPWRSLGAAAALHLETALVARGRGRSTDAEFHVERGTLAAETAGQRPAGGVEGEEIRAFLRAWRSALGFYRLQEVSLREAQGIFDRLVADNEAGEEEWLGLGLVFELGSRYPERLFVADQLRASRGSQKANPMVVKARVEGCLSTAAQHYRRALRAEKPNPEARLRLARVLAQTGEEAEAAAHLDQLTGSRDPAISGLAHLLRGELDERARRDAAALAHYRAAVAAQPDMMAALVALSSALRSAGHTLEAASVVERAPVLAARAAPTDAWIRYQRGLLEGMRGAMDRLAERVR